MGLILDSSVAISAERRRLPVEDMLAGIRDTVGSVEIALSVVSVMEMEHGIWRVKEAAQAARRRQFLEDLIGSVPVYPVTTELARKAGRIDAEQQERGVRIAFPDLLIGVSALDLGYAVATSNVRHFGLIPNLLVQRLCAKEPEETSPKTGERPVCPPHCPALSPHCPPHCPPHFPAFPVPRISPAFSPAFPRISAFVPHLSPAFVQLS